MDSEHEPLPTRLLSNRMGPQTIAWAHRCLRHILHGLYCHRRKNDSCPLPFCSAYRTWFNCHLRKQPWHTDTSACQFELPDGLCVDVHGIFTHFMKCEAQDCPICSFETESLVPAEFIQSFRSETRSQGPGPMRRGRAISAPIPMAPGSPMVLSAPPISPSTSMAGFPMENPGMMGMMGSWEPRMMYYPTYSSLMGMPSGTPSYSPMMSAVPSMACIPSASAPMITISTPPGMPPTSMEMMMSKSGPSPMTPPSTYFGGPPPGSRPFISPSPPNQYLIPNNRFMQRRGHANSCPAPYIPMNGAPQ